MRHKFTGNICVTNDIIQFLADNKRIELFMFETCCEFPYAVVTGLEPATLGVTGRYSKPTELHDYIERVSRIELPSLAWEANALPLCYTRMCLFRTTPEG